MGRLWHIRRVCAFLMLVMLAACVSFLRRLKMLVPTGNILAFHQVVPHCIPDHACPDIAAALPPSLAWWLCACPLVCSSLQRPGMQAVCTKWAASLTGADGLSGTGR